jgi:hypothetical protein
MDKWEKLTGRQLNPVRVYRPISESKAFRTHSRPKADCANNANLDEINLDKFTTTPLLQFMPCSASRACV